MSEIVRPETKELVVPLGEGITARGASVTVAKDVKYEAVEKALQSVATLEKMSQWWMGDIALQAQDILGEEYSQIEAVVETTVGVKFKTFQHYKYMAKKFPPNQRYNLPFAYHETVVRLDNSQRREMLRLADSNDLTIGEFRRHVRSEFPKKRKSGNDDVEFVLGTVDLLDNEVDMSTVFDICSNPMNRTVTKKELNEMGLFALTKQNQVHVIVMRPKKDIEISTQEKEHAF